MSRRSSAARLSDPLISIFQVGVIKVQFLTQVTSMPSTRWQVINHLTPATTNDLCEILWTSVSIYEWRCNKLIEQFISHIIIKQDYALHYRLRLMHLTENCDLGLPRLKSSRRQRFIVCLNLFSEELKIFSYKYLKQTPSNNTLRSSWLKAKT